MNSSTSTLKSFSSISKFVIVANIYMSKSQKTIKIKDLDGNLIGIAKRDEILALLAGYCEHVNVVVFRDERLNK